MFFSTNLKDPIMPATRRSSRSCSTSARRAPSQAKGRAAARSRPHWVLGSCLALALLLPAAASGAITVDNVTEQVATAASITWNHAANGSNRMLIVSVSTRLGRTVTGVTYGGLPLTFLGAQNSDDNAVRIEMWYRVLDPAGGPAPAPGTYAVVVSLSGSANVIGNATSFTGVNQVVPFGTFLSAGSIGTGSTVPGITVPSTAGDVVFDSVTATGDAGAFSPTGGLPPLEQQTMLWNRFNGTTPGGVAQAGSAVWSLATQPITMSWSLNNAVRWAIGAVPVRPAVTISGTVFEDADFGGTASEYDGGASATGDRGLPNVDVELYDGATDAYLASTVTTAAGTYSFPGLSNGTFKVRVRSATIGDADTPPRGGLNGTVPGTWPYPLPELAWANGAALYGGQSAIVDDAATGDNNGPGDTYAAVAVNSADVPNVNFGFAYNLIVNVQDDNRNDAARSTQGSVRQFVKNANAVGQANSTTASSSQFRMQVPTNQSGGGSAWWRLTVANRDLPVLQDTATLLDGATQRLNSGIDSNTLGPEIEITGFGTGGTAIGLRLTGSAIAVREMSITSFSVNGIRIDGTGDLVTGCYVGVNATGTAALGMGEDGILITGDNNTIGGAAADMRNVISGNIDEGIDIDPGATGNVVIGNYIGTDATATAAIANGSGVPTGGVIVGGDNNRIGGSAPGEGNVICGNADAGVRLSEGGSGNVLYGNSIGTTPAGSAALGNTGAGVLVEFGAMNSVIGGTAAGQANIIAYNGGDGVFVTGFTTDRNVISGNSIYGNIGLGIDLDPNGVGAGGGANNNKTRPVLTSATASGADFVLTATVSSGDAIEFFRANNTASPAVAPDPTGSGEGYLYLGRCVDNGACSGPFVSAAPDGDGAAGIVQATLLSGGVVQGDSISTTATDAANGTSEFSANQALPVTLSLVKQAWTANGSAPLASPLFAPVGSTIVFLIYVKNTSAITATDVRITDLLDETAFQYIADSLVRTPAATPPADTATDLDIFTATAPGTGTNLSDSLNADAASALDTNANTFVDRITVGAVTVQENAVLDIAAHTTFAVRFAVVVR